MSRFDHPTNGVPQPYEIIDLVVTGLKDDNTISTAFGGSANIFAHRVGTVKPTSRKWLIIRQKIMIGGVMEHNSGWIKVAVQAMTVCNPELRNADKWHSALQNRINKYFVDTFVTLPILSEVVIPMHRTFGAPAPVHDQLDDTLYTTSEFEIVLAPKS